MNGLPRGRGCIKITFENLSDQVCLTPEIWSYIRSSLNYTPLEDQDGVVLVADYMQYHDTMRVMGVAK